MHRILTKTNGNNSYPVHIESSTMNGKTHDFIFPETFKTESGAALDKLTVRYKTWGKLNEDASNAVLVCHALTGNADADDWFPGLFDDGGILDPSRQFIVCSNVLGGCYGTTGPVSTHRETNKPWQGDFPDITIRDMVRVQQTLMDYLKVHQIELAIGGSMGGMQVLEWLCMDSRIQKAVLIAMGKCHSPWTIGFSEAQRRAIRADKHWNNGFYEPSHPPADGLAAARMMGMMMYRSAPAFERRFGRNLQAGHDHLLQVNSYLNYQGDKLVGRFDANTYVRLTTAMDSHDVSRGRGTFEEVLGQINVPVLIIGISSDVLYPPSEQIELADLLGNGTYAELTSDEGHDAFLIEFPKMVEIYRRFNEQN
jgi:homoserine O-acetyltransferase/O-succinyltransferase